MTDTASLLAALPAAYGQPEPALVAKMPRGGQGPKGRCRECGGWHATDAIHLDYVGHADITRILIEVDPLWSWEPAAWTDEGEPRISQRGTTLHMWGWLTVLGKRMLCVGTCEVGKTEAAKELIGDLLRNGAMRFGIALSLWSKADRQEPHSLPHPTDQEPQTPPPVAPPAPRAPRAPAPAQAGAQEQPQLSTPAQRVLIEKLLRDHGRPAMTGTELEQLTKAEASGLISELKGQP